MSLAFGEEFAESNSNDSVGSPSHGHKRRSGRKKFRETRHPVYRGVRERNGSKWVCEVREPHKKSRIWLGTYPTPEMAARAHDVAAIALRGNSATLNFPDSAWLLPRVRTCCPEEIQEAAAKAAEMFRPVDGCGQVKEESRRGRKPGSSTAGQERMSTADTSERADVDGEGSSPVETTSFIDEEELFNMPLLLSSMAEGMMLSPPSMHENGPEENYDMGLWPWND